jgi:hypothetical protein
VRVKERWGGGQGVEGENKKNEESKSHVRTKPGEKNSMKQSGKDVRVTFASFEKSKDWKRRENVCV